MKATITGKSKMAHVILGIETSCDETSVALLEDAQVCSCQTYTQKVHERFGGIVPEVASRAHLQKIVPLCDMVFSESGKSIRDVTAIAVTDSPGLAGALLVGVSFAYGMHCSHAIPLIGINHLEGHMCSIFFEYPALAPPFLALIVSGGHTALYHVYDVGDYRCLGRTVDDAAGEAFDKVGKMLGFSYPAGRRIEEEAKKADPENRIPFPVSRPGGEQYHFSFSGIKTALRYYIEKLSPHELENGKADICYSFQESVFDALVENAGRAAEKTGENRIILAGGVACNSRLRMRLREVFGENFAAPSPWLCTDNSAMIARAGYERLIRKKERFPKMNPSRDIC